MDYLLRFNGEYFGFRSDGDPLLVIGRETVLNGEINSCDMLVVEGQVEATVKECSELEITQTGKLKGQVELERADISGVFDGELTARRHLVVRATGRVTGKVRFGELEIERGGRVTGDIQAIGEGAAAGRDG
jgi:cytoskeletal protein CcmA (bactofilin family)